MTEPTDERRRLGMAAPVRQRQRPKPTSAPTKQPSREASMPRALASPSTERSEYDVGYGKPPKHSQFRAGQSGNPNGRPKGAKGLSVLLREESLTKITLRENGKEISITKLEAAIKRLFSDALSGKVMPMKMLLPLLFNAEAQEATASDGHELSPEDKELVRYLLKGLSDE